jgi:hypothetical protein
MSFKACGRGFKCLTLCGLISACIADCQSGGSLMVERAMLNLSAARHGAQRGHEPNRIVTEAPARSEAETKGEPLRNILPGGDQQTSGAVQ